MEPAHKKTVLIVDDNPNNLMLLHDTLAAEGFRVYTAQSGEAAIECVERSLPDVILMDIMMPEMNGIETCKRIKAIAPERAYLPVIFVTALHDMQSKEAAYESGGVDFISKPFNAREIVLRLNTHIEIACLRDALSEEIEVKNRVINELESFSHVVAHDLKNPLANMEGLMDTLISLGDGIEPKDRDEIFSMLQQSSQKMRRLIDSFLLLSSLETDEYKLEPVNLDKILQSALSWHTREMKSRGVVLHKRDLEQEVLGQKMWLEMGIRHLISNALEYGGSEWTLTAETEKRGYLHFHFKDNGSGVPMDKVEYLYRHSGELSSLKRFGVGMGTSVIRMIADRLGGMVGYQRTKDGCSDFWLALRIPSEMENENGSGNKAPSS